MSFTIRLADVTDYPAIRDLQIASWQRSYAGLMTDTFLNKDMPETLRVRWSRDLGPNWRVSGVWRGDDLLGFITLDLTHDGGPYVDNLHVAHAAWGQGVGQALMSVAAKQVITDRQESMWLTVVTTNERAIKFYSALGGEQGAAVTEYPMGQTVQACPMRWPNMASITALAAHCD